MAMHSGQWSGSLSTGCTCATWMTASRAAKTRHRKTDALKARGFERLSLRNCVWRQINSASYALRIHIRRSSTGIRSSLSRFSSLPKINPPAWKSRADPRPSAHPALGMKRHFIGSADTRKEGGDHLIRAATALMLQRDDSKRGHCTRNMRPLRKPLWHTPRRPEKQKSLILSEAGQLGAMFHTGYTQSHGGMLFTGPTLLSRTPRTTIRVEAVRDFQKRAPAAAGAYLDPLEHAPVLPANERPENIRPMISPGSYFAAPAFCTAQRLFTASAIRFRPSGDRFLFFFFAGLAAADAAASPFLVSAAALRGLPAVFLATAGVPPNSARACCNRAMSRSMLARISEIAMYSPWLISATGPTAAGYVRTPPHHPPAP